MGRLADKLTRLSSCPGLVLYRWTSTTRRVSNMYIPLTELRLNILTCTEAGVHLSVSAPVLTYSHGRPSIVFYDEGLMTVTEGPRKGISMPPEYVHDDEPSTKLKGLTHMIVDEHCPAVMADKVLSMGSAPYLPQMRLMLPDVYRITRNPENIRPVYTAAVLRTIGATSEDTPEQLRSKFLEHVGVFSEHTDAGYVFNNELVAAGGMPCVTTLGISRSSGSRVLSLPMEQLKSDIASRQWRIHLNEQLEGAS